MEYNKAYHIQHHDEGCNTRRYKYRCEGYRIMDVEEVLIDRYMFKSSRRISGYPNAIVPEKDLQRYFKNNRMYDGEEQVVLTMTKDHLTEKLLEVSYECDCVDKIELKNYTIKTDIKTDRYLER